MIVAAGQEIFLALFDSQQLTLMEQANISRLFLRSTDSLVYKHTDGSGSRAVSLHSADAGT